MGNKSLDRDSVSVIPRQFFQALRLDRMQGFIATVRIWNVQDFPQIFDASFQRCKFQDQSIPIDLLVGFHSNMRCFSKMLCLRIRFGHP